VEPLNSPKLLRIAMLDVAKSQQQRLATLLDFPHEFAAPADARQTVDAVVALRFGRPEAERYETRLIHLPGAGADAIDTQVLEPGCTVCNVFEHEIPIAEYVLAAILDHSVGYGQLRKAFDAGRWTETYAARRTHGEIYGKTLGLVGYGHIGKAVTKRAQAFGMRVHAISNSGNAPEADWAARPDKLNDLLPRVDFLVIACPLTEQTRGLIGARELELMKPTAVLINIGRAQVVEEEPLYRALAEKQLGGATLDVWYDYPAPGRTDAKPSRFPFDQLSNVHCTAHSCAWTEQLFERRYAVIADNLARLHRSNPLRNVIFTAP
jgi:phosphoglycerate dehydrogenase-like enzyme